MEFDEEEFKPNSFREDLYQQVEDQSDICDVTVQIGQWKKKFHWCVLVVSPFFECMRRSDIIAKQTGLVKMAVAPPLTTEIAILFLYGMKPNLTEENVAAVLELSEFLLIPNLKSACVAFIKNSSPTVDSCVKMLQVSSLYEFEIQCDNYIRGHLPEILQKEEARLLTNESVFALLSDPELSYVQADDKFKFAIRWANESQQNKEAFPDVFEMIDLKSMDGEFLKTVVLQHPLVTEMKCDHSKLCLSDTRQDHRVLVLDCEKWTACFDLESERWCRIEIGLPEDSQFNYFHSSVGGTSGPREVYRVGNWSDRCNICIQNLNSKACTETTVSIPENTIRRKAFSAFDINRESFVAVSNQRTNRPVSQRAPLVGCAISIYRACRRATREHITTIYYGQLQVPEFPISPLLSLRNAAVDLVCINTNNVVGFYSKTTNKLHIYDVYNITLDTLPLKRHFASGSRSEIQISAKEAGFVLYNNETVLSVSRLNGPDLTVRYTVQKTKLEHDRKWDRNIYIYSTNMWFRLLRKEQSDDFEFSSISHDALTDINIDDVAWKQLPSPTNGIYIEEERIKQKAFMMELPKEMLRCHFNCPHCRNSRNSDKSTR